MARKLLFMYFMKNHSSLYHSSFTFIKYLTKIINFGSSSVKEPMKKITARIRCVKFSWLHFILTPFARPR